ncbi:HAD family phosphatase [Pseudomonas akapageensis]|uniref:HAD family phosphatase n=1 Tax=Pseudomonas akapageensis TaxID=2609961 RepID=UPI0014092268|nr:HAD family phosphatase [Pseudomonas akapageensis]
MPQPAPFTALLFGLRGCLVDAAADYHANAAGPALVTPGALEALDALRQQGVPCAWLDELPDALCRHLATPLPDWMTAINHSRDRARWPAPDACWQALMTLKVERLDGCVLVSGEPRLLQAGLNAGLWTVGLASCTTLRNSALTTQEQEHKRARTTLQLFNLGVHSVIDHLMELEACLSDISLRRSKGEKP